MWRRMIGRVGSLGTPGSLFPLAADHADAPLGAIPSHITIASEGARPPYNYFDGDHLAGFELDLGRDLCARMAVTCSFVAQDLTMGRPAALT